MIQDEELRELTDLFEREYNHHRGATNREARLHALRAVLEEFLRRREEAYE